VTAIPTAATEKNLNDLVRDYWEQEPCGTGALPPPDPAVADGRSWFAQIEERRYSLEPFIHSAAQFTLHRGERILEIGVGAGTDHLQWARAGAVCHGIDITDAAIDLTREQLAIHGLESDLTRVDAERLPFEDGSMDLVYSWGVIHHSKYPERIVKEIHRVLRPGGVFVGMVYARHSAVALKLWVRHALLERHPRRTLGEVVWNHMESIGTKAYTAGEVQTLFASFETTTAHQVVTPYDRGRLPRWPAALIPPSLGWFIIVKATK